MQFVNAPEYSGQPTILWQKMKNGSTPQKSNLPEDQGRLDAFMRSPGRKELELRERLLGKNTLQAGRIIAEEFVWRFGESSGTLKTITNCLIPSGRAPQWEELDYNITQFCKQYHRELKIIVQCPDGTEEVKRKTLRYGYAEENFFDRVRFVLYSLPRQKDYKIHIPKDKYVFPSSITPKFVPCFLCWRSVPRIDFRKTKPLCHSHDLPSVHREYRRRKRMQTRESDLFTELLDTVPTPVWVRQNMKIPSGKFFADMCTNPDGFFPYLAQYITSLHMPLDSPEKILRALEFPLYFEKLPDLMQEAWERHFNKMGRYFEWNFVKLLRAEAWLQAEAEYKHGGQERPSPPNNKLL